MGKNKSNQGLGLGPWSARTIVGGSLDKNLVPGKNKPSVRGQNTWRQWISLPGVKVTSAASTGVVNTANAPALSSYANISSVQSQYDEFRCLGIQWLVVPLGANSGTLLLYVDDADASAPTQTKTEMRYDKIMVLNSSNSKAIQKFEWRAQNLIDLGWLSTASASSSTFASLKMYGNLATYETPASTDVVVVMPSLLIEFRGMGGV